MSRQIFINLPVSDLEASKTFFAALGFSFNPDFTDENAACMIISNDHSYAMLLAKPFFKGFTPKEIADAKTTTEVLLSLSCDSREAVDAMVAKAVAAGGKTYNDPKDYGFMYQHGFEDLDGHIWEMFHMSEMPPKQE